MNCAVLFISQIIDIKRCNKQLLKKRYAAVFILLTYLRSDVCFLS